MADKRLNTSDRKVIETTDGALRDPDFRLPEVNIVGYGTDLNQTSPPVVLPPDGTDPDAGVDLGVPSNIQIERMDVRIQPDGSAVVDLLASYEPAEAARSHEVRISRL